jgi:hypothetical protein
MELKIKEIGEWLQAGNYTPHQLADLRVKLSGAYAFYSETMEGILREKHLQYPVLKERSKSEKEVDRLWIQTEQGLLEAQLKIRLKSIEKLMSSVKTMLDVLNTEARSQY